MNKYFSLFSGIGGFELGIGRSLGANATCAGYSEIDKYAIQIYKNHFNHRECGNVQEIDWNDIEGFELLVGGFPCQAFSMAGKRRGFDDTRGTLFFEIARAAQERQPRLLLLENVKGLLSHNEGKTFGVILTTLDELGYDLQWQVLNSKDFGVPQNRERVFIVGHLRGTTRPEVFPYRAPVGVRGGAGQAGVNGKGHSGYIANPLRLPLSKRVDKNTDGIRIRRLTPVECERLQGFPDNWTEGISDTQRYKCLGNAVTVNVVSAIVERLGYGQEDEP